MAINIGCFDYGGHWRLWDWLAKNPTKQKADWPGWVNYPNGVLMNCFACSSTAPNMDTLPSCKRCPLPSCQRCPLNWPYGRCHGTPDRLYTAWDSLNPERANFSAIAARVTLANKIRDLPLWKGA